MLGQYPMAVRVTPRCAPALQDILERSGRELGRPLGGRKVDCRKLKVGFSETRHVNLRVTIECAKN